MSRLIDFILKFLEKLLDNMTALINSYKFLQWTSCEPSHHNSILRLLTIYPKNQEILVKI